MRITCGLSPLARGTPNQICRLVAVRRFIPAGAGNTQCIIIPVVQGAVYPRWRGEHLNINQIASLTDGLSPLARGTRSLRKTGRTWHRFIPAGAGNTPY
ncbi:hypothetical protein BN855_30020 [Salmonella enterica subsp. enterica serovar Bovismorbificans str. 3114]|nr:hypothetical protein BN855_30020 [Salmonella enterica subsp. enterica serovar Bovismorbificans str. 3114]